jgi:hypothetical protein
LTRVNFLPNAASADRALGSGRGHFFAADIPAEFAVEGAKAQVAMENVVRRVTSLEQQANACEIMASMA